MYATPAQLKTYLGVTSTADDALLTDLLVRATTIIEQMTRKTFAAPTATSRTFGRELMLWDAQLQRDYLLLPSGVSIAQLVGATDGDNAAIPLTEIDTHPPDAPYTVLARQNRRWCGASQQATITARPNVRDVAAGAVKVLRVICSITAVARTSRSVSSASSAVDVTPRYVLSCAGVAYIRHLTARASERPGCRRRCTKRLARHLVDYRSCACEQIGQKCIVCG